MVHRAELGTAHGAERSVLETFFRQRFIVHGAGGFGIQREIKLPVPIEADSGHAKARRRDRGPPGGGADIGARAAIL